MNILLPKGEYSYYDKEGNLCAKIVNGMLEVYRSGYFKEIMYDMAYKIYGTKCFYCGKEANSIDHKYPQDFGGPTITDNLVPTCKICNNRKANMLEDEYRHYLSLKELYKRKEYVKSLKQIQEDRRYGTLKDFPKEWISDVRLSVLKINFYIDEPLGVKYKKLLNHFNNYQKHKNVVVVSANGFVLDGFNTVFIGKQKNRADYLQIILENVIWVIS